MGCPGPPALFPPGPAAPLLRTPLHSSRAIPSLSSVRERTREGRNFQDSSFLRHEIGDPVPYPLPILDCMTAPTRVWVFRRVGEAWEPGPRTKRARISHPAPRRPGLPPFMGSDRVLLVGENRRVLDCCRERHCMDEGSMTSRGTKRRRTVRVDGPRRPS